MKNIFTVVFQRCKLEYNWLTNMRMPDMCTSRRCNKVVGECIMRWDRTLSNEGRAIHERSVNLMNTVPMDRGTGTSKCVDNFNANSVIFADLDTRSRHHPVGHGYWAHIATGRNAAFTKAIVRVDGTIATGKAHCGVMRQGEAIVARQTFSNFTFPVARMRASAW